MCTFFSLIFNVFCMSLICYALSCLIISNIVENQERLGHYRVPHHARVGKKKHHHCNHSLVLIHLIQDYPTSFL